MGLEAGGNRSAYDGRDMTDVQSHPQGQTKHAIGTVLLLVLIAILILLVAIRKAIVVDFTHDESRAFLQGVLPGIQHLIMYDKFINASNHVLSTLGMYLCSRAFGTSELSLRLPSLLALAVWIGVSMALACRISASRQRRVAYFLLLQANPLLFDLFSAARGYGPAYAFLLASLTLYMFSGSPGTRSVFRELSIVWLANFAVLSNMITLYYLFALVVVLNAEHVAEAIAVRRGPGIQVHLAALAVINTTALIPVIAVVPHILKIRMWKGFHDGGVVGFFQDTLQSIVASYGIPAGAWACFAIGTICFLFAAAVFLQLRAGSLWQRQTPFGRCLVVLTIVVAEIILAFLLLNNRLPIHRTALLLIPLFSPLAFFLAERLSCVLGRHGRVFSIALLLVSSLQVGGILWTGIKTPRFHFCQCDASTEQMMLWLESDVRSSSVTNVVTMGADWFLEPSINYYRETTDASWLGEVNRYGYLGNHDYFHQERSWLDPNTNEVPRDDHEYLYMAESNWMPDVHSKRYMIMQRFPESGNVMAKRIDLLLKAE